MSSKDRRHSTSSAHAGKAINPHDKTFRYTILKKLDEWQEKKIKKGQNKAFYFEVLSEQERRVLKYDTFKSWVPQEKKEAFYKEYESSSNYGKLLKRKREIEFSEAEAFVIKYLEHRKERMKDDNCGVNRDILRIKVMQYIAELLAKEKNNEALQEKYKDWTPSNGWFEKVMKRNDLVSTRLHGDAGEIDRAEAEKKMEEFRSELQKLMESKAIPLERVYNADQWAWYYQKLPDRTIVKLNDKKDARGTKGMRAKARMTGMVATSATGHKIRLAIIGKTKHPHCFDNLPRCPQTKRAKTPLPYNNNKTAWFNQEILIWWLTTVFKIDYVAKHSTQPCILILDNFNKVIDKTKVSISDSEYEYVYEYLYGSEHTCVRFRIYVYVYAYGSEYMYMRTVPNIYVYMRTVPNICTCVRFRIYMCTCVRFRIYMCIYASSSSIILILCTDIIFQRNSADSIVHLPAISAT
jgi:DDE superfamily endonuclease